LDLLSVKTGVGSQYIFHPAVMGWVASDRAAWTGVSEEWHIVGFDQ